MYTNCDSLLNKRDELDVLICSHKPQIVLLTEILPKNSLNTPEKCEFNIVGYECYIPSFVHGRGVAIYVHETLESVLIESLTLCNYSESVWCSIRLANNDKLLAGCVYRSPNSSNENNLKLNSLMKKAVELEHSHILICGDFNYKEINWHNLDTTVNIEHEASIFLENIRDTYLIQHVTKATRYRENQQDSCLDLIFTNEDLMIDNLQYKSSLGASDHLVLVFDFICYIPPDTQGPPRRNFFKGDYEAMREVLLESTWDFDTMESIDDIWNMISDRLCQIITDFVPESLRIHSYKQSWMNKDTAEAIDRKRRAWTKLRNCNNTENCDNYKSKRNMCTNVIRTAKQQYEKSICLNVKDKPKVFWSYIKSKSKTRDKVCDLIQEDGSLTANNKEKADVLNKFFSSVFTREDTSNVPVLPIRQFDHALDYIIVTPEDVFKKLSNLNPSKAAGPDGLHCKFLYELRDILCEPLASFFNRSLQAGEVPTQWRQAHVSPIFKKGDKKQA